MLLTAYLFHFCVNYVNDIVILVEPQMTQPQMSNRWLSHYLTITHSWCQLNENLSYFNSFLWLFYQFVFPDLHIWWLIWHFQCCREWRSVFSSASKSKMGTFTQQVIYDELPLSLIQSTVVIFPAYFVELITDIFTISFMNSKPLL